MVVVLSRFRVANRTEAEVAHAFRQRPRDVERTPGFLWLEVLVDAEDPSIFYLLTRWTDRQSFETWHRSPAHRKSHALIPKGLKLDPTFTKVYTLDRIDGTTGPAMTEAVVDAALLVGSYAAASPNVHFFRLARDGTIRAANAAAREQLAAGLSLEGQSIFHVMPEADASRLRGMLETPGRDGPPALLNFAAPNRTPFSLYCWLDVLPDDAVVIGEPPVRHDQRMQDQLMAINQDLAIMTRERSREAHGQREKREAAERLNRDRNAFLRVLCHELRQPLGGALAALGLLRKLNPDERLTRARAALERQLHQINRLVEDLADTARIASGDVELRRSAVDLTGQLREMTEAWTAQALEQHRAFSAQLPDTSVVVMGDVDRLQQVFTNLVGNAFKYTRAGGTTTLALTEEDGVAVISVTDDGEGMAPDQLPHVFDLFQRATATGSGLGVGLAVVRALVDAHGGYVTAASGGIGQGATFTVHLPLSTER
jgi:signal transduction histidine kinase/heme-degrading monooxygenase HmoA